MFKSLFTSALTLTLASALAPNAASAADFQPRSLEVALSRTYIPVGYDDNDDVQIAIAGELPDTCHRIGSVEVKRSGSKIEIHQNAYLYGGVCVQLAMGYNDTVDLGILAKGKYEIVDGKSGKTIGVLNINAAPSEYADTYLYAPVSEAYLFRDESKHRTMLQLTGTFRTSCLHLKEVKIERYPDVLVVLPIAENDGTPCKDGRFRFSKLIEVKGNLKADWLLHVRTMHGRSINKLQDLPLLAH